MEPRERLQFPRPVQQPRDGLPRIGQVGPGMTHALRPRVGDRRQPLARRHQPLAEPVVARRRAEEVAEPHDQRRRPLAARRVQPPFQLHADAALFRDRVLRRILLEHGKRIVPVVVNRARQHDPRPTAFAAATVLSIIGSTSLPQLRQFGGFTACTTASAPSAARRTSAPCIASPATHSASASGPARCAPAPGSRAIATTCQPCRSSAAAVSPLMPPVAPSTRARRFPALSMQFPPQARPPPRGACQVRTAPPPPGSPWPRPPQVRPAG